MALCLRVQFFLANPAYILRTEIEKVNMFCKVLNKQFIKKPRAIFIINKTQLHTPIDCFTIWRDHQGDLNHTI